MSYVSAIYNKDKNIVQVVERDKDGNRIYVNHPAEHTFYYPDSKGKFRSIFGDKLSKYTTNSSAEFQKEKRMFGNTTLFESDFTPIARCLENKYLGQDGPDLHIAFFDIEVNFDKIKGYAPTDDTFNNITAISMYLSWSDQLICLVMPPKTLSTGQAQSIVDKFDNTFLYTDEKEMLLDFLNLIEDADVLSGWNSEGFDIPYIVNRIKRIMPKGTNKKLCLWDHNPKKRTYEKYGAEEHTYDLVGRIHMDSMLLYQKYTYQEMHSYALDIIGEYELDEKKIPYEGTLDELFNNDFEKFIKYSLQDSNLLYRLDQKLKFIDLSNTIAHANTVLIPKTMGAVAVTEQGIINEAHERGFIVHDKKKSNEEKTPAAGAYVAYPVKGIHKWLGSYDINSLYPSVIRALNMSNETIVGQLRQTLTIAYIEEKMSSHIENGKSKKGDSFAAAWEGKFASLEYTEVMDRNDTEITIDWEGGGSETFSASHIYDVIYTQNANWTLSANGTIFTLEKEGIIPGLLERWYAERKVMQKKKREATDPSDIAYYDKLQLVKKILLNSLYGGLLNKHHRFHDKRIGQSTTLTGRSIVKSMSETINESLTGERDYKGKSIIYGDTDSCYVSVWPMIKDQVESGVQHWDNNIAIAFYDSITDNINTDFPRFMKEAFHCPSNKGEIIKCGREVVGSSGLFITKKRYAIQVIDNEGDRYDKDGSKGKIKAMGLDLKRSDTLPVVQEFLKGILDTALSTSDKEAVIEQIIDFKDKFTNLLAWEKGTPKRVNKLSTYTAMEKAQLKINGKGARLPGHVRGAMNYNTLRDMNNDNHSMPITDGMKCIVCKLKDNDYNLTSVSIPTDEDNIPDWFKELPFDHSTMEKAQVNKKIDNLLGLLEWDLEAKTDTKSSFTSLFDF